MNGTINRTINRTEFVTAPSWTTSSTLVDDGETGQTGWQRVHYLAYGIVMLIVLTLGLLGNVFTIIVLSRREHRHKLIVPFVINLALADIFIVLFGYPVAIYSNVFNDYRSLSEPRCIWSAFVNCAIGIASIATYVVISALLCFSISSSKCPANQKLSTKSRVLLLSGIWAYGILSTIPPLFGWNRFVPGAAGISCCPDWTSRRSSDISYNLFLVFVGFFLPLTIISICFYKIIRFFNNLDVPSLGRRKSSWIRYQRRIGLTIATSVAAFVLSWAPYCIVSVAATIQGSHLLRAGAAEIPELLAKASVVYNPLVFTVIDNKFRQSLRNVITCRRFRETQV